MSMSRNNLSSPSGSTPTPNDNTDADLETPNDTDRAADSETTPVSTNRITYPRFLVVEGLDPKKTLRNVNRTILTKTIEGATSTTTKKQWMGKLVLVEVTHEAYFTNLMKLNQIGDMPVKVSAHRSLNYAKGVVRFKQAAEGLTNEELARYLNMSWRNNESPQVKETSRVIITKGGRKVQTGTFFLTFDAPTLPKYIFLGFERFDVTPYIPLLRRCFKCQQFGHGARTCRATENVCPLCSGTGHKQDDCPNKESVKCPNCDGAHPATSKECPVFITEKRALEIQTETRCTLPAAREQAGQTASAEQAASSYARVLANNRADLVNRNLALSDENARLKEVINTLRQDNASLQQRLDGYEQRLQTLEKSMLGGTHADVADGVPNTNTTSVGSPHNIGVHNTTSVGSSHNTTPVGDAHNTTPVGEAHKLPVLKAHMASQTELKGTAGPRASMSPAQMGRIEGPRDAPSYIPNQSPTPRRKLELSRKGPSFVPVISPMTKAAPLRNHRKGQMAKQPKS